MPKLIKNISCVFAFLLITSISSLHIYANEIDLDTLFREDASVFSEENQKEINNDAINMLEDSEDEKPIVEEKEEQNDTISNVLKEESIVMELEQEIVYDNAKTGNNVGVVLLLCAFAVIITIGIGIFVTYKNSKR